MSANEDAILIVMSANEDTTPHAYPYSWSQDSNLSIEHFLEKYRPSMVQNNGMKPWIWVRGPKPLIVDDANEEKAKREASELLKEVTDKVEGIKNDPTIPTRSNKKTGAKSKKEIREQVQSEATEKLAEIAVRNGYVCGKWLIFASSEKVDKIWSSLASSLVSGPLAATSAFLAKVATSPKEESSNHQHVICIYMPNVYERDSVTEVMKVLLRHHGVNLSGVKSDMYTSVGIYSKHVSGISSTLWKASDLLSDAEVKELKDMYFAELTSNSKSGHDNEDLKATASDNAPAVLTKPKPKLKLKKKTNDDPFVSDDNDEQEEENQPKEVHSKTGSTKSKRKDAEEDEVDSGSRNKKSRKR